MSFEIACRLAIHGVKESVNDLFPFAIRCHATKLMGTAALGVVGDIWNRAEECIDGRCPIASQLC